MTTQAIVSKIRVKFRHSGANDFIMSLLLQDTYPGRNTEKSVKIECFVVVGI